MSDNFKKSIAYRIRVLAIYQISGGILGIGLTIWLIMQMEFTNLIFLLLLISLILNSYSIYCGILLLNKKKFGINHSLINQYLQLINFSILGYGFTYISGVYFSIGLDLTDSMLFKFNLGVSTWQININRYTDTIYINFNLVALVLIIFINNLKKKISEDKIQSQVSEIGEI